MTKRSSTPADVALVAIDMSKYHQEVLIESPEAGRRRRMTVMRVRPKCRSGAKGQNGIVIAPWRRPTSPAIPPRFSDE